jgi:hypothetical protein
VSGTRARQHRQTAQLRSADEQLAAIWRELRLEIVTARDQACATDSLG